MEIFPRSLFSGSNSSECRLKTLQFAGKYSTSVLAIGFDLVVIALMYLRYQSDYPLGYKQWCSKTRSPGAPECRGPRVSGKTKFK